MDQASPHMVVGLDGSSGSAHALRWAQAHTGLFGRIQPVWAWRYPWWAMTPTAPGALAIPSDADFQTEAEHALLAMVDRVPPAEIEDPVVVHGAPGPILVELGATASLIVVGSRGRGPMAAGLLGSVSLHCVNHATVPVAVVPAGAPVTDRFRHVIVGVDGSDHSIDAVTWALRHASDDTVIEAITAWSPASSTVASVDSLARDQLASQATALVDDAVEEARVRAGGSTHPVAVVSECGDARDALRQRAPNADLLVVGARGRSGIASAMVGSVTTSLVHDPLVPIVVVR